MVSVTYDEMRATLEGLFQRLGMQEADASLCARVVTDSSFDGVISHGIAKVPGLVDQIRRGVVKLDVRAKPVEPGEKGGAAQGRFLERWDGCSGIGIVNATAATARAGELARIGGIGCVALRNTNHWFRAGTYGRQACEAGFGLLAWTNTVPNMPAWGARSRSVGNNPLVAAVPHAGTPIVLDMALSQFALGGMALARQRGEHLPVPGGFDAEGRLTDDPEKILDGGSVLPVGFWKGSGLALLFDLLAALLSGGNSTADLALMTEELDVSQIFIAFDLSEQPGDRPARSVIGAVLDLLRSALPVSPGAGASYPGERTSERRARNLKAGLKLDVELWKAVRSL